MNYWAIKKKYPLLVLSMLVVLSLPLHSEGEMVNLSGTLIYSKQNSIRALDLSTLKSRVIYEEKDGFPMFLHLTKIDNKRLLIEDEMNQLIKELDLDTGIAKTILHGLTPQYISGHEKLFFYAMSSDKAQKGIFIADMEGPAVVSAQIVREGSREQVIQVSEDEVIFYQDEKIWLYNIVSGVLRNLPLENCTLPKVMRSVTGQLLCFDATAQQYFLTDLKGEKTEYIPTLRSETAVLYIPEYDALIFGKTRFQFFPELGEVIDIWSYSFKGKKEIRLQKNVSVSLGSAIWLNK